MARNSLKVQLPPKFDPFRDPHRYKVCYGGRASGKSWSVARMNLIDCLLYGERILCLREFQRSIKQSSHKLLTTQIRKLNLGDYFEVQQAAIYAKGKPPERPGRQPGEIFFEGLKHNVDAIRSYEGITRASVEEAANVSETSWQVLTPTIREPGSEIWVSFNPVLETDATYKRFVIDPPDDCVSIKINFWDNPWFPEVLRQEMVHMREKDPDGYLHVWEGKCRQMLEGAIFARELRAMREEGRITNVPYDPSLPVDIYTDIGFSDYFSAWFVQTAGMEFHVIDFLQDRLKDPQFYGKAFQSKKYNYRGLYLPHDGDHRQFAAGGRTVAQQFRAMGFRVHVIPRMPSHAVGHNAARAIFPMCVIDEGRCADGLQSLYHYRFEVDPDTNELSKKPAHDWASHAAKAFQQLGLNIKRPRIKSRITPRDTAYIDHSPSDDTSWMQL